MDKNKCNIRKNRFWFKNFLIGSPLESKPTFIKRIYRVDSKENTAANISMLKMFMS